MDQLKKLLEVFNEETTPSQNTKESMWQKVSGSVESEKRAYSPFTMWMQRGAPLFVSALVLVVGVGFYSTNFAPQRALMNKVSNSSEGGPLIEPTRESLVDYDSSVGGVTGQVVAPQYIKSDTTVKDRYWIPPITTAAPIDYDTKEKDRAKDVSAYFVYYVKSVRDSATKVYEAVVRYDGVVVSSEMEKTYAFYTVTVPVSKFEQFRKDISPLAVVVKEETIQIKDRQNEKTALQTKLSELETEIAAVRAQLQKEKDAAKRKVLQAKLDTLLAEQTRKDAELKVVVDATTFAKVSISLREDDYSFLGQLTHSLKATFQGIGTLFVYGLNGAITGVFLASPFVLLWALISFLVKKAKARR